MHYLYETERQLLHAPIQEGQTTKNNVVLQSGVIDNIRKKLGERLEDSFPGKLVVDIFGTSR